MADPFATVAELVARWRPLTPSEEAQAIALLGDASALMRARVPDLDQRLLDGTLDADLPRMVVCAVVKRAMIAGAQPPTTQQSESFGGFSYSATFANPQGDLYLTASDLKALRPPRQAGMINLMPNPGKQRY